MCQLGTRERRFGVTRVMITGAHGFIGRNVATHLRRRSDMEIIPFGSENNDADLKEGLDRCDSLLHFAGVSRPKDPADCERVNCGLTERIVRHLESRSSAPTIVFSSSILAAGDSSYGRSKRVAEEHLLSFGERSSSNVYVYRLPNVFGKWCRPDHNSVVATFCDRIARGAQPPVHNPKAELELVYVDDVVTSVIGAIDGRSPAKKRDFCTVQPVYRTTVGQIAAIVRRFPEIRSDGTVPPIDDPLTKLLYATYLTHIPPENLKYELRQSGDDRGILGNLLSSRSFGHLFYSQTVPGASRGHHYHDTKAEKFCVVHGTAEIRLRNVATDREVTFTVRGSDCRAVDIPPGVLHSLKNIGDDEVVTLFWSSEIPGTEHADTHHLEFER